MPDPDDIDFSDIPAASAPPSGPPASGPGAQPVGSVPGPDVGQSKSLLDMPLPEMGPDEQRALRMIRSSDPHVAAIGQHILATSPAYQSRKTQVDAMAKFAGQKQDARLNGENVLGAVAQLVHTVADADDEDIANATGPQNTAEITEQGPTYIPWTHVPIPGLSGPNTIDPRTEMPIAGTLTHTHRQAILNPDDPKAQTAWDLQQRLLHNVNGITTAISSSAGGPGMKMTDDKMKVYGSAAQDFMHASTPEGREKILRDLIGLIQQDYNLTPNEADRIIRHHFGRFEQQAYIARKQGVPQEAIDQLVRNQKDPDYVHSFDRNLNKGRPGMAKEFIDEYNKKHQGQPEPPPIPKPQPTGRYGAGEGTSTLPAVPASFRQSISSPGVARPPPYLTDVYGAPTTPPGMIPQ